MGPLIGETLFSSVPPSNFLVSVSCVASGTTEIQGHRQVWRARRGGPRTPSTTPDANLDCAFVENALFLHRSLIFKCQQNRIELVTRPDRPPDQGDDQALPGQVEVPALRGLHLG